MPSPRDVIQASDAVTGDVLWEHRRGLRNESPPTPSTHFGRTTATSPFTARPSSTRAPFRVFEQKTVEVLREIKLGSSVFGLLVAYALDGRQYVAVNTDRPRFTDLTPAAPHPGEQAVRVRAAPDAQS